MSLLFEFVWYCEQWDTEHRMELGAGREGSLYICAQNRLFSLLHDLARVVYKLELQSKGPRRAFQERGIPILTTEIPQRM